MRAAADARMPDKGEEIRFMPRTGKNLIGERFGKLTVTGFFGYGNNDRQRYSLWECRCDCGNICQVQGYVLQNGRRKSCGCLHSSVSALVGQQFGRLTVLREDPDNRTTLRKVICRCDCGREKSIATRDLKRGRVTSCGCEKVRKQKLDFRSRFYDEELEKKRSAFQKGEFKEIHTLKEWVYVWIQNVLPNVIKETTICMYAEIMEHHILPLLGKMELKAITEETVKNWVRSLKEIPVSGTQTGTMTEGTARNTLSVLSGCMRDAQKYGLIAENPCSGAAWILEGKNVNEHQEWLSAEQVGELEPFFASYKDEDGYPIGLGFQLVLYTGITLSEAAALRWRDVDLEYGTLYVRNFVALRRGVQDNGGERRYETESLTGRKQREVPVPEFLMEQLQQVRKEYQAKDEDFVLCKSDREPVRMDRMRAALLRKGNCCGMGTVTPRMLRDTYAMRAVQAGATSDMIAELMGFASSQQVIRRYMPKKVTNKRDLVNKMFAER